ncbi:MAG TPA: hypothetical protein VKI20_02115 [Acidimicrobiales bacterium]|nr:hypothetical protein [Acidimicrobiales bacterium]
MNGPRLRRRASQVIAAAALAVVAWGGWAAPASAHPLGNFTVNRYARIEVSAGHLRVYYVLDEAEIPAFQDRAAVTGDPRAFAASRADAVRNALAVSLDGSPLPLTISGTDLSQPLGQAGLRTLRLAILFDSSLPAAVGAHDVTFADRNEPDRIGWREIVTTARGDAAIVSSTAPTRDVTDELRRYPANLIQSPLDLRGARFHFLPGSVPAAASAIARAERAPVRAGGRFAALIARHRVTPRVLAAMLGVAVLLGAAHGLAPGHGKTIMAAYVVGGAGHLVDAALVGLVVAAMHTASVVVLGAVLFQVSRSTPLDRVFPWLTLGAGLVVATYGLVLFRGRMSRLRQARRDPHGHHVHGHHDQDIHSGDISEGVSPLSRRGLVLLATAGGLFPSPSALLVLIGAFTLGRVGLGLALVGAFSVGLAVTLSAVAVALVYGSGALRRRRPLLSVKWLPVTSAAVVVLLGLIFVVRGASAIA